MWNESTNASPVIWIFGGFIRVPKLTRSPMFDQAHLGWSLKHLPLRLRRLRGLHGQIAESLDHLQGPKGPAAR